MYFPTTETYACTGPTPVKTHEYANLANRFDPQQTIDCWCDYPNDSSCASSAETKRKHNDDGHPRSLADSYFGSVAAAASPACSCALPFRHTHDDGGDAPNNIGVRRVADASHLLPRE